MAEQNDISHVLRQRCVIEFCVKLRKSSEEVLQILQNVYGTEAISRATVFRWWKHFKDGNKKVVDDARSGKPSTAVTDVNIDKAKQLLKEGRRLSLRELSGSLNVSLERVHHIITVELGMSRVCARWVPCDLSDEQKRKRVEVCQQNVTLVEQNPDFLSSIITCDESWIRHYDLESNQQSSVWKHKDSPAPKKFRTAPLSGKVMLILFFDLKGIILQHWLPQKQTVNGVYYANTLKTHLGNAIRKKRPEFLTKRWLLLQDNAQLHTANVAMEALADICGTPVEHPSYSPNLAPCDFLGISNT
jgi:hypothetical protein